MPHKTQNLSCELYQISPDGLIDLQLRQLKDLGPHIQSDQQYWLDVIISDRNTIMDICILFNLHHSLVDELLNLRNQRPKAEIFDNYVYWVVRIFETEEKKHYHFKKFATLLVNNFAITFRESNHKISEEFLKRLNSNISAHHAENADYLALFFLDRILEVVFIDIDNITEQLQFLEEMAIKNPKNFDLKEIYILKRKIIFLRKLINPIISVANMFKNTTIISLNRRAQISLQKIYDLCYRANDILDLYQQMINNIYDMYLSTTNYYTNRSITLLTRFSTVFIPISFITGIYGMNFRHMPEIYYTYSYPIVLGGMAIIAGGLWYGLRKYLDM